MTHYEMEWRERQGFRIPNGRVQHDSTPSYTADQWMGVLKKIDERNEKIYAALRQNSKPYYLDNPYLNWEKKKAKETSTGVVG